MGCRRPLNTMVLAEQFLLDVLDGHDEVARDVVEAELNLVPLECHPTSTHEDYRNKDFRSPHSRKNLRNQILTDLMVLERLENDDEIALKFGGAKPKVISADAQAYIVSGAPASGKSGIAGRLANETGSYILDSDYAKRKFPEYSDHCGGASLVHAESDQIIFAQSESLYEYCVYNRYNVVIPLVGRTYESVDSMCHKLVECGYSVHIINIALDRYQCVRRAFRRFKETRRYVPLSYIFDEVGNEPERIYFLLKRAYGTNKNFRSFAQLSTDVAQGENPSILEASKYSPVLSWSTVSPPHKMAKEGNV